jgi:hypothetical protein
MRLSGWFDRGPVPEETFGDYVPVERIVVTVGICGIILTFTALRRRRTSHNPRPGLLSEKESKLCEKEHHMKRESKQSATQQRTYESKLGEKLLGSNVWKSYEKLKQSRQIKSSRLASASFARAIKALNSQAPLRTLPPQNIDPAELEKLWALRRAKPKPRDRFLPRPLGLPTCYFTHNKNYTFARPNPEYISEPRANLLKGIGSTEIEEYADALSGKISLGFAGGNWLLADGTSFFSSPMPLHGGGVSGFVLKVDGIVTSGSVFDVADVSALQYEIPSTPQTNLVITASVHCPVRQFGSGVDQNFDSLFQMRPGLYTSPAQGLIAVTANLNLTASTTANGQIVNSSTNSLTLMRRIMNSGPGTYGTAFNLITDDCVFLFPNLFQTASLATSLPLGNADQLIIEAEIELAGLRIGNNAPGAGYIGATFQDNSPQVTRLFGGTFGYPCPFQITSIQVCPGP